MKKGNTTRYPGLLKKEMEKKMRHLIFGPASDSLESIKPLENFGDLYAVIYEGTAHTPRGFGKVEVRLHGRILSKLESVGTAKQIGNRTTFVLNDTGGTVSLEDTEFKLFNECLAAVEWTASGTRNADAMYSWVELAPKELPKLQLVEAKVDATAEAPEPATT